MSQKVINELSLGPQARSLRSSDSLTSVVTVLFWKLFLVVRFSLPGPVSGPGSLALLNTCDFHEVLEHNPFPTGLTVSLFSSQCLIRCIIFATVLLSTLLQFTCEVIWICLFVIKQCHYQMLWKNQVHINGILLKAPHSFCDYFILVKNRDGCTL